MKIIRDDENNVAPKPKKTKKVVEVNIDAFNLYATERYHRTTANSRQLANKA